MFELIQRVLVGIGLIVYICGIYLLDLSSFFVLIPILLFTFYDLFFLFNYNINLFTYILAGYEIFGAYVFYQLATTDRWLTLSSTLIIAFSDIVQYLVGKYAGQKRIGCGPSPNKTILGYLASGLIIPYGSLLGTDLQLTVFLILVGITGDLFVSFNKRRIGIKDISNLLGSHGGWLDRVDGVYMGYFYLYLAS